MASYSMPNETLTDGNTYTQTEVDAQLTGIEKKDGYKYARKFR